MVDISHNSNSPTVSVLIGTRNRAEPLALCLESVLRQTFENYEILVLDDASDFDIAGQLLSAKHLLDPRIRWMRSERPSGVAGARNKLTQAAGAPILIFLDDDAYFENSECIERVVRHFTDAPSVGIIAFNITLRGDDEGKLQVPFTRRSRRKDPLLTDRSRTASYYVGAAHATRKEVFERCGMYQDDLFYGHEELDLSYSAIQQGFQIMYAADIPASHAPGKSVVIAHRPSNNELFYKSRNRIWVAYKHLPLPYLLAYTLRWTAFYGLISIRQNSLRPYLRGILAGLAGVHRLPRRPLGNHAMAYLKSNFGRLWY